MPSLPMNVGVENLSNNVAYSHKIDVQLFTNFQKGIV